MARFFLSVNFQCLQIQLSPEARDLCFPRPRSLFDLSGAQPSPSSSPSQNRRHPIRPHLPSHVSLQRCVFTSDTTRALMSWRCPVVLSAINRPKKTIAHSINDNDMRGESYVCKNVVKSHSVVAYINIIEQKNQNISFYFSISVALLQNRLVC